ncbi:hypothetical protein [Acetobacter nitrogenifigens]|uniref:hypothetical protein n=1 Tax=Acetobacter nitrogenifigens TaxID=285268 RepID=UPI001FEF4053|nr:hypothetical protein [Acetobacter nitrogenifigens]
MSRHLAGADEFAVAGVVALVLRPGVAFRPRKAPRLVWRAVLRDHDILRLIRQDVRVVAFRRDGEWGVFVPGHTVLLIRSPESLAIVCDETGIIRLVIGQPPGDGRRDRGGRGNGSVSGAVSLPPRGLTLRSNHSVEAEPEWGGDAGVNADARRLKPSAWGFRESRGVPSGGGPGKSDVTVREAVSPTVRLRDDTSCPGTTIMP